MWPKCSHAFSFSFTLDKAVRSPPEFHSTIMHPLLTAHREHGDVFVLGKDLVAVLQLQASGGETEGGGE